MMFRVEPSGRHTAVRTFGDHVLRALVTSRAQTATTWKQAVLNTFAMAAARLMLCGLSEHGHHLVPSARNRLLAQRPRAPYYHSRYSVALNAQNRLMAVRPPWLVRLTPEISTDLCNVAVD